MMNGTRMMLNERGKRKNTPTLKRCQDSYYALNDERVKNGFVDVYHFTAERNFSINPISIQNNKSAISKPIGGLWTSPVVSSGSWRKWCIDNSFQLRPFLVRMRVRVTRCFRVEFEDDLRDMPWVYPHKELPWARTPDFEQMKEMYECIWLTDDGQWNTRLSTPDLYGWDCETILILNETCVERWDWLGEHGIEVPDRSVWVEWNDDDNHTV